MVSTVTSRPNHYELLGLTPTASREEIARAFAREIGRPRALGGLALISVAYETLRDPARRRAYDLAIGVAAEPTLATQWAASPYLLRASVQLAEPRPRAAPRAAPQPAPEPPAQPELPSFIARSLSELARPEPLVDAAPAAAPAPKAEPEPPAERVVHLALDDAPGEVRDGPAAWKRIGIGAGALVIAVALLGAWAGSRGGAEPKPASVSALLAPPTTFTVGDPTVAAPVRDEARPLPARRTARVAARAAPSRPKSRLADLEAQLAEPASLPAEPPADAAPPAATAAAMPLPSAVVARTIARIGYPCGTVASATPAEAGGAFTLTCTSGHSYRAAPVRGRYHFRRLGGR